MCFYSKKLNLKLFRVILVNLNKYYQKKTRKVAFGLQKLKQIGRKGSKLSISSCSKEP